MDRLACLLCVLCLCLAPFSVHCAENDVPKATHSSDLQSTLNAIILQRTRSAKTDPARVHVAIIDLKNPNIPAFAQYNGKKNVYPASVIKMIYMGYVYQLAKTKQLTITPQIYDTLYQMIHPSSNEATAEIVDLWSGVRHDKLMDKNTYATFAFKRNACNRWLRTIGLQKINANQKTWGSPIPDGERQFLSKGNFKGPWTNRNSMSAMSAARFLQLIAADQLVDARSCQKMRTLMRRDVATQPYQKRRIAGGAATATQNSAIVWSKSGTTSTSFHDAGIVRLKNGHTFALAIFITGKSPHRSLIHDISKDLCTYFDTQK